MAAAEPANHATEEGEELTACGAPLGSPSLHVGWPADGQFSILGAFDRRFCYNRDHGCLELLLWFEDTWMQDSDLGLSEGSLHRRLNRDCAPDTVQSVFTRQRSDCVSDKAEQIYRVVDEQEIRKNHCFRIQWKLQWMPVGALGDPEWAEKSLAANDEALQRRRSGRHTTYLHDGHKRIMECVQLLDD